jgi:ferredoxin/flavodoxin---NADP+ reductase
MKETTKLYPHKITDLTELSEGKFTLKFEKKFNFKAGQVVSIAVQERLEPRIYSLCSGENEKEMQILFDLKNDGKLTPLLSKLRTGDEILVSEPYGSYLPDNQSPMWWIATGTGIAPFYSMLKSGYRAEKLLHGARGGLNFFFANEFTTLLGDNYIQCNSTDEEQNHFSGYVTDYLAQIDHFPVHNKYYLCGRALIVVEVRDLLISKGVPFQNIVAEIFF